jgi:hypothetical protein
LAAKNNARSRGATRTRKAIVAWFYPGETTGHEFLYFKHEGKELAGKKHQIASTN